MPPPVDLTNQRFGRLVVIERFKDGTKYTSKYWVCKCDCGKTTKVLHGNLRSGNSTSCGCGTREALLAANTSHGMRFTSEYGIWLGIKTRCYNDDHHSYDNYGHYGIGMSDEWRNDFMAFYNDMGPRPSKRHSVERRENDKDYCKENCYWAPPEVQANNKSNNVRIEYKGEIKTLAQWCKELNVPYKRVYYRMKRDGKSFEDAIKPPFHRT